MARAFCVIALNISGGSGNNISINIETKLQKYELQG
jgi:hypothetical protein